MASSTGSDHSRMMASTSVSRMMDWAEAVSAVNSPVARTAAAATPETRRRGKAMFELLDFSPRAPASI
ncbi:hypothetical protein [Brevundimonas denitrificans]|uniref:hypothetical protein n=1 Tax=Brevundimonas denitrificans TaxID=1443434 RepID=UPI00223BEDF9|nr:hypothetical protein [Brevundimonas denitrificans]